MDKNAKIFNIIVKEDEEGTGFLCNSLVDEPAVEYTKYSFADESTNKTIKFGKDKSEQKFMSVSMLANTPIPRKTPQGELYYVNFTPDTIKTIVNKLVIENKTNIVSFQHTDKIIDGIYLVEHFIVKKGRVESPMFSTVPDGSWITTYYVKDKNQYEQLLNDEKFNGFSIELSAQIEEAFSKTIQEIENSLPEKNTLEQIEIILKSEKNDDEKYDDIEKVLNKK